MSHEHTTSTDQIALRQAFTAISAHIETGKLTPSNVSNAMTAAFGGTDASGAWEWRLAFDLMQAAGLKTVLQSMDRVQDPMAALAEIQRIGSILPTETRRSERQIQLQQFSTAIQSTKAQSEGFFVEPR